MTHNVLCKPALEGELSHQTQFMCDQVRRLVRDRLEEL